MQEHELLDQGCAAPLGRTLQARDLLGLAAFTVVFFAGTSILASWRFLNYDECLTYYLARLPELVDLWRELMQGAAEQNPPLNFLFTRASFALFGESPLAARLPAAVGVWCLCLCLFLFVARRGDRWGAWVALLFPLCTQVNHFYAYEARPYGLMLGFTGLALVCWQAVEGRRRPLAVTGLAVSLACLAATHYFGLFCFLALGAGELVRWVARRRPDFAVAAAFLVGLLGLAACYPQLAAIITSRSSFWAKADWYTIPRTYMELLGDSVVPVIGALIVLSLHASATAPRPASERGNRPGVLPLPEATAAAVLALLPVLGVAAAKALDGGFVPRYGLPMIAGCGILLALCVSRLVAGGTIAGGLVLAVFLGWFLLKEAVVIKWTRDDRADHLRVCEALIQAVPGDEPIVVAEGLDYVKMAHSSPPAVVSRLVFLFAVPYTSDGPMLHYVPAWMGLRQEVYHEFLAVCKRFTVYGPSGGRLAALLQADGARIEVLPAVAGFSLYKVELPPSP